MKIEMDKPDVEQQMVILRASISEDQLKSINEEIERLIAKRGWLMYKGVIIMPMEPGQSPLNDPDIQRAMVLAEYVQDMNL